MLHAPRMKFNNQDAKELLLSAGEKPLIEASSFDYFWAAGQDGIGLHKLGKLLVQVRKEYRLEGRP
jgi:predicted NAD-dependent protein-ADP-ribosyltransferase YbiA (DUF1768 family)